MTKETHWYVVPKVGSGTIDDSYRAKYTRDKEVEGTSQYPISSDYYIVRILTTDTMHESIQSDSDADKLDNEEVERRLNEVLDENLPIDEWNERFDPGKGLQ